MNNANFAGYLGRDAELRSTPSGQSVLNFSVGVSIGWGDKKKTLWVGCAIWGERAEKLDPYLKKGQAVAVSGDVDFRTYETKDGKHGAELLLNVQRVTLMGKGNSERAAATKSGSNPPATGNREEFDDDIPF